jgi:hypothetical protein
MYVVDPVSKPIGSLEDSREDVKLPVSRNVSPESS